jgi:DNA topoisomerase-1
MQTDPSRTGTSQNRHRRRSKRHASQARRIARPSKRLLAQLASQPAPVESARAAGLRYVSDNDPGIQRRGRGKSFLYLAPDGRRVTDSETLARIRRLAIPPAWTDVWIATRDDAHLQATGRDARGRKQYRYHPDWRAHRDDTKYTRMIAFAEALPRIRHQTSRDLESSGLTRTKVVAAIVQLLEKTLIRVGNEEYARANGSFGLTTMRDQHVEVTGKAVHFEFKGKSGKKHSVTLEDPRLARVVRRCQDLPGQVLFQYVDDDGERQTVDSADINQYLRDASGADFTAKDFRTWAGTVLAAIALREFRTITSKAEGKRNVVQAIERVAARLGNTTAVCRKCYVHPAVLAAYLDGSLVELLGERVKAELANSRGDLSGAEMAVLALLQRRLAKDARRTRTVAS